MPPPKKRASVMKAIRKTSIRGTSLFTHPEVEKFFVAQLDPFAPNLEGVGNTTTSQPAHAFTGVIRGVYSLAANDTLFIGISPCLANNLPSLFSWNGSSAQSNTDTFSSSVSAGEHTNSSCNSPYSYSDFLADGPGDLSGRIISAGIELEYAGIENNRGGNVYFLEDDDHRPVAITGSETISGLVGSILGRQTTKKTTFNVSPKHKFAVGPVNSNEHEFTQNPVNNAYKYAPSNFSYGSATYGSPVAWVIFVAPAACVINYTYIQHYQFIGAASVPMYQTIYGHPEETETALTAARNAKQSQHKAPLTPLLNLGVAALKAELVKRKTMSTGTFLKDAISAADIVGKVTGTLAGLLL